VDVTTILAAAIAGASGVGAGYLGMRQQAITMREQLRAERDREHEQRAETLLDGRVKAYHELLDIERRLRRMLASQAPMSSSGYAKWWTEFEASHHLVVLTGAEPVRSNAVVLRALYGRVDEDRLSSGRDVLADALRLAFQRHEPELEHARESLISAMRSDVAPDQKTPGATAPLGPTATALARQYGSVERAELAVVSTSESVPESELRRVAAAVETQLERDFRPAWGLTASLTVYARPDDLPAGAWPVVVADDIGVPDVASFHSDSDGTPITMITAMDGWSRMLSHDCLEMLVSPFNRYVVEVPSPKPDQGRVLLLVQVCDPCASPECAYEIDGVTVADFLTPGYLTPVGAAQTPVDHVGALKSPLDVAPGGYLTWYDPATRSVWRHTRGAEPPFDDLGMFDGFAAAAAALKVPAGIGFFGGS
jgi:hypothetical protein